MFAGGRIDGVKIAVSMLVQDGSKGVDAEARGTMNNAEMKLGRRLNGVRKGRSVRINRGRGMI